MRRTALRRRDALDARTVTAAGARITQHVTATEAWRTMRTLHTYVSSLPNEVDTHGLVAGARERGVRVLVPVVAEPGAPMRHARIDGLDELSRGPWDLWQPKTPRFVDPDGVDVILVPGVVFDRQGYRVGHGGGYYDRFLGGLPAAAKIGLTYDEFFVDRIPREDHDLPVDIVITESGLHIPSPIEVST